MDEFNSIIEHLLSSSTLRKNRRQIFELFCHIIVSAKQIICVDADISDLCFLLLDGLKVPYDYRVNTYKHNDNVVAEELLNPTVFVEKIKSYDKFLVCFDSKTQADRMKAMLEDDEIVVYGSEYDDIIIMDMPKIFITPKVIYGLDSALNRPVFGYFTENTISPKSMLQQIARERSIQRLYYCFPMKNKPELHFNFTFNDVTDVLKRMELCDERFGKNFLNDVINFNSQTETSHIYMSLLERHLFNSDAYSGNKYLHFRLLLKTRGFNVLDINAMSNGFDKIEIAKYDKLAYEDKLARFKATYDEERTSITFNSSLHSSLNEILHIPPQIIAQAPEFVPKHILDLFLKFSRVKQHYTIVDLFIAPQVKLIKETNTIAETDYLYSLVETDKHKILWLKTVMNECNVVADTLNATTAYSSDEAKIKYNDYNLLFPSSNHSYTRKIPDFTNPKVISDHLFKALRKLLPNIDEDLLPVINNKKQISPDSDGKRVKYTSYDLVDTIISQHKEIYYYRNNNAIEIRFGKVTQRYANTTANINHKQLYRLLILCHIQKNLIKKNDN